jgi:hypothetical protein
MENFSKFKIKQKFCLKIHEKNVLKEFHTRLFLIHNANAHMRNKCFKGTKNKTNKRNEKIIKILD